MYNGLQILDELSDMLVERLLLYDKRNKKLLPKRIFVFRDGVSEVSMSSFQKENAGLIMSGTGTI